MRMHLVGDEVEEGGIGRADSKVAIARHALQDQQVLWADAQLLQALVRRQVDVCALDPRSKGRGRQGPACTRGIRTRVCAPRLP